MKKNFSVKDAVFFEFAGETLDARGDCELLSVEFRPGAAASVEMNWRVHGSNRPLQILFSQVNNFVIKGRDEEYPLQSGVTLGIAGFSCVSLSADLELFVEPTPEMNYMTFVMDDESAIFIEAETAVMRHLK